jgi:hypothetical protein
MLRTGPLSMRLESSHLAWSRTTSPKYQDCRRHLALWMSPLSPGVQVSAVEPAANLPSLNATSPPFRRSCVMAPPGSIRAAFASCDHGGSRWLVGLGGAEFRLPLLSEFSRFAALQPIIPWSHRRCRARLAELLLLTSHQARGDGIP